MRPTLIARGAAALLLVVLLVAGPAAAQAQPSLWGRSSTFVRGYVRPTDRDVATHIPFYELVELHGRRLGVDGLSLHASFWGLVDVVDLEERYRASGDVSTLYLTYRAPSEGRGKFLRGLEITAGRQLVALGPVILEQVDGGKLSYLHSSGLELGVFGGAPTGNRFAFQPWPLDDDRYSYGYDWMVGGRIGFLDLGHVAAGASFVQRRYRGRLADNDLGLDVSYSPLQLLELSGTAAFSLEALRVREGKGAVRLRPVRPLDIELSYQYYAPDLWVPRASIFSVFSDESYHEAALDARWQVTRALSFDVGYGYRMYTAVEDGRDGIEGANRASLRGQLRYGPEMRGRTLLEGERVEAPENAYTRVRVASSLPFTLWRRVFATIVELDLLVLDELFRGSRISFTGGGYLEVPFLPKLRLVVGGNGNTSPLLKKAGSFLARLTWEFDVPSTASVDVRRGGLQ